MTTWPRPYFLVGGNEDGRVNAQRSHFNADDEPDDLGIFGFARKTAQLLVPMAIIAGLFGMWLRSELLVVRKEFGDSLALHSQTEQSLRISRQEFELFKESVDRRFSALREQNESQSKLIQRNTMFLERISQKLGISRPPE